MDIRSPPLALEFVIYMPRAHLIKNFYSGFIAQMSQSMLSNALKLAS
jgi:hypothetical protein